MLYKMMQALGLNPSQAHLRRWRESAARIGELEEPLSRMSDAALREACRQHRVSVAGAERVAPGRRDGSLEASFALAREASRRVLGMRHFDVQLVGAMALHEGKLAEMKTGEGKSLCLTLAGIHNALMGDQTHVVTVNEYLARRDAESMAPLYDFFGLEVGLLAEGQDLLARREQYGKDVVYGVNHEFGFDYLRHNMARSPAERRMVRGLKFAIVDEVDSILIDEARTPLIISGSEDDDLSVYSRCWAAASSLSPKRGEVEADERMRTVSVSESGFEKLESGFVAQGLLAAGHHLYEPENGHLLRALQACLQARFLYHRDQHYIVSEGKVLIVDENTGRLMPDRRWSNGIHQAMEAKEGVEALQESKTLATITYQNFFGLYEKLSGLTGTAMTQAGEFWDIYGLEAVPIPTHRPMVRKDRPDVVYRTQLEKFQALAQAAREAVQAGRPVLAGTSNIEESEKLAAELAKLGVPHQLLNAKNHALEAQIVEEAGLPGRVTVATNMAGRGTDIVLGGNWSAAERALRDAGSSGEEVSARRKRWEADRQQAIDAGGLLVLGCARNDSRRVDNQLRGRSGRQGDPGESRFFIALEDSLFRIYGNSSVLSFIHTSGMMPEGSSLEHPMLSRSLERAQASVEGHHFNMRKQLQDFDGVGASQRKIVYAWRDALIDSSEDEAWETARGMVEQALDDVEESLQTGDFVEVWSSELARRALASIAPIPPEFEAWVEAAQEGSEVKSKLLTNWLGDLDQARSLGWVSAEIPKSIMIERLDDAWQEHLTALQGLMDGIHLRSYAQKDPKQEYKREGYEMFSRLRGAVVGAGAGALLGWARLALSPAAPDLMVELPDGAPLFPAPGSVEVEHWLDAASRVSGSMPGDGLLVVDGIAYAIEILPPPARETRQPASDEVERGAEAALPRE